MGIVIPFRKPPRQEVVKKEWRCYTCLVDTLDPCCVSACDAPFFGVKPQPGGDYAERRCPLGCDILRTVEEEAVAKESVFFDITEDHRNS
jgi:hypothetical protein